MNLTDEKKEKLASLAEKYRLACLILFGSQAREAARPDSDFDIGYRGPREGLSLQQEQELQRELEEIFSQEIDLRSLHSQNPYFLYSVLSQAKFLAGNPTVFAKLQSYALGLINDARYDIEPIRKAFLRKRLSTV